MKFRLIESIDTTEYDNEENPLTKEQSEFFKNSKVRDKQGRLLVCYHGSPSQDITSFNLTNYGIHSESSGDDAIYFTSSQIFANNFSHEFIASSQSQILKVKGKRGTVYSCYLLISNPFDFRKITNKSLRCLLDYNDSDTVIRLVKEKRSPQLIKSFFDFNKIRMQGYDGIISNLSLNYDGVEYGCFEPNQIKSIDNRNPSNSNNINEDFVDDIPYENPFGEETGYWTQDGMILYRGGNFNKPLAYAGYFFSPFKKVCDMYGRVSKYLLNKNAHIFMGYNTAQDLCLDNPEYLDKHYTEILNVNKAISHKEIDNLRDSFDQLGYIDSLWGCEIVAKDILSSQGYDGVKWNRVEDDFDNLPEYQIWNLDKVKKL